MEHFEECFDRFCQLHSWYKISQSITVYMYPVKDNVQEPDRLQIKTGPGIYWHFYTCWNPNMYCTVNLN